MIQIPATRLILLDTCVAVQLQRANQIGLAIESHYGLSSRPIKPLLSTIVEGEIYTLTARWNWGASKLSKLSKNLQQMVRVSAGAPEVVAAYAEIAAAQQKAGAKIGENDTWIAATARAADAVVLTTDGDYLKLVPGLVDIAHFDPATNVPTP